MKSLINIAATAYNAYGSVTDYKNFRGDPMPAWEELPDKIKRAWIMAVASVIEVTGGKL